MSKKGFTLIEILVVIVLIGVIASLVLPRFISQPEKAKMAEAANALGMFARMIQSATFADGSTTGWYNVQSNTTWNILGIQDPNPAANNTTRQWQYESFRAGGINYVQATRRNVGNPPTSPVTCVNGFIRLNVTTGQYTGSGCYSTGQRYDVANVLRP